MASVTATIAISLDGCITGLNEVDRQVEPFEAFVGSQPSSSRWYGDRTPLHFQWPHDCQMTTSPAAAMTRGPSTGTPFDTGAD